MRSTPTPKDCLRTVNGLARAVPLALDDHALEDLHAARLPSITLEMHLHAVAWRGKVRERGAVARGSMVSITLLMR